MVYSRIVPSRSLMDKIAACGVADPGSIPGGGTRKQELFRKRGNALGSARLHPRSGVGLDDAALRGFVDRLVERGEQRLRLFPLFALNQF